MPEISRWALMILWNAAWVVTLVYVLASAAAWLFRDSPRRAHLVWLAAFGLSLALPFVPAWNGKHKESSHLLPLRRNVPVPSGSEAGKAALGAYVLVVTWSGARHFQSWRKTRRILATSRELPLPDLIEMVRQRFRIPRLLFSPAQHGPLTAGSRQPTVVLPENLYSVDSEDLLVAVLGHEAAHIQRRDVLVNLFVESLYPLLAMHPCAGLMRRRIRDTRELACDEIAASRLTDRSRYAAALLDVAWRATQSATRPPAGALAMSGPGNLEERIRRLAQPQIRPSHRPALAASLAALLFLAACAAPIAFGLQIPSPRDYAGITGVWVNNWGSRFRPGINIDLKDCCFTVLEIRDDNGKLTGSLSQDTAGVQDNTVKRGPRLSHPIEDPILENGTLRFRHTHGQVQDLFELTPAADGGVMLRDTIIPSPSTILQSQSGWTRYTKAK